MAGALLNWISDLCLSAIGPDGDLFTRLAWRALNESRRDNGANEGTGLPSDLIDLAITKAKRVDWLLMLDPRLWKKAKWDLRSVYSRLYCVEWDVRRDFTVRLAHNYVKLFEHFLVQDREVDTGVLFGVSYMLFGNGEACAYACRKANLFETVLDVAQAWFTGQVSRGRLTIPPADIERADPQPERRIIPERIPAFRGKKGSTVFGHVRGLFKHEEMQKIIAADPAMFNRACQLLNIFVGIQTQRKENSEHIEFEVDWPRTFTYLGDLSKAARELGESLRFTSGPHDLLVNISNIAMRVTNDITLQSNTLDPERYRPPEMIVLKDVFIPGSSTRVIHNDMTTIEAFSFHHYMNLLLAEAYKSLSMLRWTKVQREQDGGLKEVLVTEALTPWSQAKHLTPGEVIEEIVLAGTRQSGKETDKLAIMEYPLQSEYLYPEILLMIRTCYSITHPSRFMAEEWSWYAWSSTSLSRCPKSRRYPRPGILLPPSITMYHATLNILHCRRRSIRPNKLLQSRCQ